MIGRADIKDQKQRRYERYATSRLSLWPRFHGSDSLKSESNELLPFVPHEISVLAELILGHLRYLLTDVPPQPNSPPDNVFRRIARRRAFVPKEGSAPPSIHGINDEAFGYLKRVIVTPAARLVEFLHFDIQSTGRNHIA
ncbi:hypothetical protein FNV43_RR20620 [Rhamnella rubrinervis]|uniref:Uncharacterized protein n=1 Tax=Rhamnella rubrinervis TaxID=2594499 RepID=A0A8K0E127_9ROSA|nr:hypothetical protein FNV43_RR20620 [Rhamnella rubrinervis]